ncbi:MAG: hypothetical protein ACOH5I_26105 [Oligoflexus sp.]
MQNFNRITLMVLGLTTAPIAWGADSQICLNPQQATSVKNLEIDGINFCNEYSFVSTAFDKKKMVRRLDPQFMENQIAEFLPKVDLDKCSKNVHCAATFMLLHTFFASEYRDLKVSYENGGTRHIKNHLTFTSPLLEYEEEYGTDIAKFNTLVNAMTRIKLCKERRLEANPKENSLDKIKRIIADSDVYCGYYDYRHNAPKSELSPSEDDLSKIYIGIKMLFDDHIKTSDDETLIKMLSFVTRPLVDGHYSVIKVEFHDGDSRTVTREEIETFLANFKEKYK